MSKKCYSFAIGINSIGRGYIYANNVEEAKEKIRECDLDDIIEETDTELGELLELEEI